MNFISLIVIFIVFTNAVNYITCINSSKILEGYPSGYMADCPPGRYEPVITDKSLKRLSIYSQGNSFIKQRYNYYQMKELATKLDFSKPTMLYVGGYLDSPWYVFATTLCKKYRRLGYNALALDTNYFTTMQYPLAALFTRTVGKHTAEMLSNLTYHGLDPKKLELVGLSLGGQTMSFIAKHYRKLTGTLISRLTALDPAGPCFRNLGPDNRLDQTDADFVDTINTNIDGFGMAAPVGHVNFYVNGGEYQPGDILWLPCTVLCSHIRAFTIWISALQYPNSFIAVRCSSVQEARDKNCYDNTPRVTNVVGLNTNRNQQGVFFLATGNNFPYFLGQKGLEKKYEFFSNVVREIVDSGNMVL